MDKLDKKIVVHGAREHNLKDIHLEIPKDKFIVFTGVSGSGKSSLAFDTIFAEGQRRYLESLSAYARQFLTQMEKPDVDYIEGLSPAIAIDQKSASRNPRSTVGTVTEIHDYLRLLFARIGIAHCPKCGREIQKITIDEIIDKILIDLELKKIKILAPIVRGRKGEYLALLNDMFKRGFAKAIVDGGEVELNSIRIKNVGAENLPPIHDKYKKHDIDIFIDELDVNADNIGRITESVELALKLAEGIMKIQSGKKELIFNQQLMCAKCGIAFAEIEPRLFSFNSPYGACLECDGLGNQKNVDPKLVIPDKNKTIEEGGVLPWTYKINNYYGNLIKRVAQQFNIPLNTRVKDIPKNKIDILLYGPPQEELIKVKYLIQGKPVYFSIKFHGIIKHLEDRYRKTDSDAARREVEKYISSNPCPSCKGMRLKKEALLVKVGGKNIGEINQLPVSAARNFIVNLELNNRQKLIAKRILKEIENRLKFLDDVGLGYLMLERSAATLAGGESQRIRLASQLGSSLTGVLYILDEPSIGLHQRDNGRLLDTLEKLRDLGNTVIAIEHDEETMRRADWIVDIGPRAGKHGGKITAEGPIKGILKNKKSVTARYLSGKEKIEIPKNRRRAKSKMILVKGAREHNLKNINVGFPVGIFTCVTGVSGSGKSSLVNDILQKALARKLNRSLVKPGEYSGITGDSFIDKVVVVDQSPIGRTPRSNPATYVGFFTTIRELFAATQDARVKGYSPGRFSFNVSGGRCENCKGDGFLKVEMQFLPDVYVPCDVCKEKRYNSETLKIEYKGKNISQVLDMTVEEALAFFWHVPSIKDKLKVLNDVGLGYIELGQSATTLSGGEAQRIKLASELSKFSVIRLRQAKTLYILDEPTTGLHFEDIKKLLEVIQKLIDQGNTVIVIEHNLDVIKTADYIIDLGPEGGDRGGKVIARGTPKEIAETAGSYTGKYLKEILREK